MSIEHEARSGVIEQDTTGAEGVESSLLKREIFIFAAFVMLATFSAVTLVTKRARLVSIAYEGRKVELELKGARERLKQLEVTRSELIVPQRLEGFAGRHGYRSAEAGQIVLIKRADEMR